MPFQSEKQRKYLWANEPKIARDWTEKYGSRVKKQLGGTLNIGYHGSPFYQNIMNQGFKGGAGQSSRILGMNMPTWAGSGKTFVASNPSAAYRYGAPIEVAKSTKNFTMPFGGGIDKRGISFAKETALDPKQATKGMQLMERLRSGKYLNSPTAQRLLKTGTTALTNPTNWARMLGVPLSALTGILSATPANADEASMTLEDFSQLANNNQSILPKAKPRMTANWSQFDDAEAQASGMFKEEDENGNWFSRYLNPRNIAQGVGSYIGNKISRFNPFTMGFNAMKNRMPYRPATGAVNYGGKTYSPAQLNSMNALGGYYSQPARQQRQLMNRRTNILKRAGEGKPIGNVNLLKNYGYKGTPSGGVQFTGRSEGNPNAGAGYSRSDSGWSSSPFKKGGIASLWQR